MAANQFAGVPQDNPNSFDPDSSTLSVNTPNSAKPKRQRSRHLDTLAALPELRSIPWREGKELPPENSTDSLRQQTRGALLLVTRGVVRNPKCSRCEQGLGRFSQCVSLPGWFGGSCATCQMYTKAEGCSLRLIGTDNVTDDNTGTIGIHQAPLNENQDQQSSLKRKRKRKSANHNTAYASQTQELSSPEPDNGGNGYGSYSKNSTIHAAPLNSASTHETGGDDNTSLLQYVYQKLNPPNGKKRHHIIDQANGEVRELFAQVGRTSNSANTSGMAIHNREQLVQDVAHSLSPREELRNSYLGTYPKQASAKRSDPRDGSHEAALFDSLPRKKQKQILGIIGGLQSGIRTAKQQTDSLQKQLDLLQTALGIDFDEEDGG